MNSDALAASLMAGSTAVAVFTGMVPHMAEVHEATQNSSTARATRIGEIASTAVILALGVMASAMTRSNVPFITALIACAVLTGCYETVLRH